MRTSLLIMTVFLIFSNQLFPQNYAVRFYGHGTNDIDRIKIPLDNPNRKLDVGGDFTIEFQMKALLADNPGGTSATQGYNDDWTLGHVIIDRDIFGGGDYGDYGISLANGRIAFGVNNGSNSYTLIGTSNVADGSWHHIAVTRNSITGVMQIFVDGVTDDNFSSGVSGDVSYRDGRTITNGWVNEPYIVIGAEKHDYDNSTYPSFNGYFDELRISNSVRYTSSYSPVEKLTDDANTMALYHFDEGSGTTITDVSITAGITTNGTMNYGGSSPSGPEWNLRGINWTGTAGTTWNAPDNWSPVSIPSASDDVVISPAANQPFVTNPPSSPAQCRNLYILSGSSLTVGSGKALNVTGDMSIGSSLMLQSDITGTASLIHQTVGVSATVQRHVAAWTDADHGWHLISSPVTGQAISVFHDPSSASNDFYKWNEPSGEWVNRKTSAGGLNGTFETTFEVGKGYLIAYASDQNKTFSGILNVEDVELSGLTNTPGQTYKGWHLVGNPFSSAIKWNQGSWVKTNIGGVPLVWNETSASFKTLSENGIIPPHNGFYVYTTGNGTLKIPASARIHSDSSWYKNSDATEEIVLVAQDAEGKTAQETIISINPNATRDFDLEYDSYYMTGFAPAFYSISGNENYALNSLPSLVNSEKIQLGFIKNKSDRFSIGLQNKLPGKTILLTDTKLNQTINLSQNSPYLFSSEEGDDPQRFLLHFGTVGIDRYTEAKQINLWYANGTIFLNNHDSFKNLEILNVNGQQILNQQVHSKGITNIHYPLTKGLYIIRLSDNSAIFSTKLLVN